MVLTETECYDCVLCVQFFFPKRVENISFPCFELLNKLIIMLIQSINGDFDSFTSRTECPVPYLLVKRDILTDGLNHKVPYHQKSSISL